ncbi:NitT/TauT family transport system permease protein [Roseovarius litoreus]|uniref:NitT/TauT family transport system permease protein n=1 Tax=Roseovarius litoreus TaxID=1155722 RepID=A0A1M7KUP2_9RHOB|nr:ABC transporter permease [Roseovarius litoreus]SHM69241.1 NitT/TauT family transport system permease protein [Roseovarius litoreus]
MTAARLASIGLFLGLGLIWEIWVTISGVSSLLVPAPSAVLAVLWQGLTDGFLWPHIRVTFAETLLGFALGSIIGFAFGVLLSEVDVLRRVLWPYILASQVVPKLALGPIFIVWFGFGLTSIVIITALICFFPLLENTVTGLRSAPADQRDLFRMLGASRLQTLLRLKIPAGLPVILAGVRVSVVLAIVGAVVGEFISGGQGLGASIIAAQGMMDTTLMFALFIVITVMGMLFYQLTILAERWLLRRRQTGDEI